MDERKTECIRYMLLAEREGKSLVGDQTQRVGALVEEDDQRRDPLRGATLAGAQQIFIDMALFPRTQPGDVECEFRHLAEQLPDLVPRQQAQLDIRQCLDAVLSGLEHRRLQPDKIAGKQKIQNLPAAAREGLEAKRP